MQIGRTASSIQSDSYNMEVLTKLHYIRDKVGRFLGQKKAVSILAGVFVVVVILTSVVSMVIMVAKADRTEKGMDYI